MSFVLFVAFFAIYLFGTSPGPYGGDTGELIVSSQTLGVSHAPGYPLHALMGKAATVFFTFGGPAYRVNALSALLAAGTVAALCLLLLQASLGRRAALAGALAYASLPLVWDQAQVAEVFVLNNLLAVLLLGLFVAFLRHTHQRHFFLFSFLLGLGLANHQTLLLLGMGFLFWEPATLWRRARQAPRAVFLSGVFFVAGLSLYLFLPVRSARHPPVNFGDPHTFKRFVDVVTRREFGTLELHPAAVPFRTLRVVGQQARAYVRQNVHVLGAGVFLVGVLGLWMGEKRWAWFLFWFFSGPFFYVFSNLSPFNTLAQWRMERFLLLPSIFLAVGVARFLTLAQRRGAWLAAGLLLLLAAEQGVRPRPWFRWSLAFQDFGRNVSASLPPQALLLIDRVLFDEPTSCVMNELLVKRRRPDVRVIYRPGTLFELFYGEDILEIPRDERFRRQDEREKNLWMDNRPLAALCFARENLPPLHFQLNGVLYLSPSAPVELERFFVRRGPSFAHWRDYPTRLIEAHYPYWAAKASFEAKNRRGADIETKRALAWGHEMEWLAANVGSLWSQWGLKTADATALPRAEVAFRESVRVDPYFPAGPFGLGYVRVQQKQYAEAVSYFKRALQLRPGWTDALYNLGVAHYSNGDTASARRCWEELLELDPASPLASSVRQALGERVGH